MKLKFDMSDEKSSEKGSNSKIKIQPNDQNLQNDKKQNNQFNN